MKKVLRENLRNGHSAQESTSQEGIRTLTLTAVTRNDFSIKNTKITVADPQRVKHLWLQPRDILIERANTFEFVGLAALYRGAENFAIYPDLMVRVRVNEDLIDPYMLSEFLLTAVCRNYFRRNASGTAGNMPKIDHNIIERVIIPLFDISEQHKISDASIACDIKITALERETALLDELFQAMLEELMTGRVSAIPLT